MSKVVKKKAAKRKRTDEDYYKNDYEGETLVQRLRRYTKAGLQNHAISLYNRVWDKWVKKMEHDAHLSRSYCEFDEIGYAYEFWVEFAKVVESKHRDLVCEPRGEGVIIYWSED